MIKAGFSLQFMELLLKDLGKGEHSDALKALDWCDLTGDEGSSLARSSKTDGMNLKAETVLNLLVDASVATLLKCSVEKKKTVEHLQKEYAMYGIIVETSTKRLTVNFRNCVINSFWNKVTIEDDWLSTNNKVEAVMEIPNIALQEWTVRSVRKSFNSVDEKRLKRIWRMPIN